MRGGIALKRKIYLMMAMLLFVNYAAVAAPIDSIEQNRETGELTIRGNIDTDGSLTVQVLGKDKTVSELYGLTSNNALSVINTVYHFEQESGDYEVRIMVDGKGNSGEYTVRVNSAKLYTPYEKTIDFYDPKETQILISTLKSASGEEIFDLIDQETIRNTLNINIPVYEELNNKKAVATYLKSNISDVNSITELSKVFIQCCIFSYLNYNNDSESASVLLETYNNELDIAELNTFVLYTGFSSTIKQKTIEKLMNKNISSNDEFVYMFNEETILNAIEHASGSLTINNVMKNNKEVFKDLPLSKYWSLSDTYAVDSKIAGERFANLEKLVERINELLNKTGSSSGGGGAGGRGVGSVTTTLNVTSSELESSANPIVFNDLESVEWAREGINYLAQKGIINGKGNGLFTPNDNITREEFVKILVVAFGLYDETAQSDFNDVEEDAWYYKYIASGIKAGLINGISENLFGVGNNITRQDVAVLVWRFINYSGENLPNGEVLGFVDKVNISEYARNSVASLKDAGIVSGMSDGTYMPNAFCTRAQAAKIIHSALKYVGL